MDFAFDVVTSVNLDDKTVTTEGGSTHIYSKLVFATGSQPFVPPIPGTELDGVVTIKKE